MSNIKNRIKNFKNPTDNEILEEMKRTKESYYTCKNKLLEYKNGKPLMVMILRKCFGNLIK